MTDLTNDAKEDSCGGSALNAGLDRKHVFEYLKQHNLAAVPLEINNKIEEALIVSGACKYPSQAYRALLRACGQDIPFVL